MSDLASKLQLLGLTDEHRLKLGELARLSDIATTQSLSFVVETVIVSEGQREVIHREETIAKLVRTPE